MSVFVESCSRVMSSGPARASRQPGSIPPNRSGGYSVRARQPRRGPRRSLKLQMPDVAPTAAPESRTRLIVAVLALGGAITSLVQTLVVPLIPRFPVLLDASAADTTWLVSATLLVGAVANPVAGRLADRCSKRLVLILCLIPALLGAVISATATTLWPVILGRGLQGIGMAVIPVGITAMEDYVAPSRSPTAVALMSSSLGVGRAVGLPIAAVMSGAFPRQVLFWVTAAMIAVVIVLYLVVLPHTPAAGEAGGTAREPVSAGRSPTVPRRGFDLTGAILLGLGLLGLLLAITRVQDWGVVSTATAGVVLASLAVLIVW